MAYLGTKVIIVLGHQNCGAVKAAIKGGDNGKNLNHLFSYITPAIAASAKLTSTDNVAKINSGLTANELQTRSEIIKNAVKNKGVIIRPAFYNLDTAKVDFLL